MRSPLVVAGAVVLGLCAVLACSSGAGAGDGASGDGDAGVAPPVGGDTASGGVPSTSQALHAVGGVVTGLPPGSTVVLQLDGRDDLAVTETSAGFPSFTFPTKVASGQAYGVTVKSHPAGRRCSVTKGAGVMGGAPVTDVAVSCACNDKVLLLGGGRPATAAAFATALAAAGLTATVVTSFPEYAGTPAAADFGAVVLTPGDLYGEDMPNGGQSSLSDAFLAGKTGMVMAEWVALAISAGRLQKLSAAQLFTRVGLGHVPEVLTLTVEPALAAHPVWAGLPRSFATAGRYGGNTGSTLKSDAVTLATCPQCETIAAAVKDGPARSVQIGLAMDYSGETSTSPDAFTKDPQVAKLFVNAVSWAARCE